MTFKKYVEKIRKIQQNPYTDKPEHARAELRILDLTALFADAIGDCLIDLEKLKAKE